MDYKELNQILANLDQAMVTLEETYVENEGEVTEETEQMEAQISGLKELLTGEGIDLLGGWLKAKEDRKKSLKAEKDYITRQMSAIDETIDFIKGKISQVLKATGQEKVKGDRGYSFAATTSTKTEVNKTAIDDCYMEIAQVGARANGLPDWIDIQLKTTATEIRNAGGDALCFLDETTTPSVRFTKPRASKEA
jgi:chromosome segregation ATPase